jgi:hypothetical protein
MTQESPSPIGTVAQEAARLIEDMATMARWNNSRDQSSRYAGEPAEPVPSKAQGGPVQAQDHETQDHETQDHETLDHETRNGGTNDRETRDREAQVSGATDKPAEGACSQCGAEPGHTSADDIPSSCQLCPLCRGIGLLRSVRPETVDLLADLAMSVAAGLRDFALWSRASEPSSSATPGPGGSPDPDRAPVQDIPVDDES